jgi:1,4-dihydroxy-2-naphthoate octaprenyltransferase
MAIDFDDWFTTLTGLVVNVIAVYFAGSTLGTSSWAFGLSIFGLFFGLGGFIVYIVENNVRIEDHPRLHWLTKALSSFSVALNAFGAIAFHYGA